VDIEVVASERAGLGESPLWSPGERAFYWIDTRGPTINRLAFASGKRTTWETPTKVSAVVMRRGGGLVVAMKSGLAFLDTSTGTFEPILDPEPNDPDSRSNDAKVDRAGRFWFGTMDDVKRGPTGNVYRFDSNRTLSAHDHGFSIPNGPAWSPDDRRMYLADSGAATIYVYDYDAAAGAIRNRRTFAKVDVGMPDGATVDAAGYLWSANVDNSAIVRYAPDGSRDRVLALPVTRPTSVAFGGDDLRTLFITTGSVGLSPEQLAAQPLAGAVLSVRLDVGGLPETEFAG